jgi:hypothetical protein
MKLSIKAELVDNFADDTQVIANLENSRSSDQLILSETLEILPLAEFLADNHSSWGPKYQSVAFREGDHSIRGLGRK